MNHPMLEGVKIKNFAIVEDIHVEFGRGLNVITGETGAGKSIIIESLGLALGERADKSMIRAGEESCGIEAVFKLPDSSEIDNILEEIGIEPCDNGTLIIRRIINVSGQGKILINDSPATVNVLKKIGELLVDFHGPHDHQSLLNSQFQVDLIDSFGHLWKIRADYEELYSKMRELEAALVKIEENADDVPRRIEMYKFQIDELEKAQLTESDEEDLEKEHKVTANSARILELAEHMRTELTEDENAIYSKLVRIKSLLDEFIKYLPEKKDMAESLENIIVQVQDISDDITRTVSAIEHDQARLQWLEDRMALIHRLKRKYGSTVKEMLAFMDDARQKLAELLSRNEKIEKCTGEDADLTI